MNKATVLRLIDNRFHPPKAKTQEDQERVISSEIEQLLKPYAGKSLNQWSSELGVIVFPDSSGGKVEMGSESDESVFFHLESDQERAWINTGNCMGVVKIRGKNSADGYIQIEISSRFDQGNKMFFLNYLLNKVFNGSMAEPVSLGSDSFWDMLLAFVFRRRLLEANAVGLFKQYQTLEHNDARIRGRIDVNEHLRRNIPFCGKIAYSTREITFDNPTNHLIRHALAKANREWPLILSGYGLTNLRHDLEQNTPSWQPGDVVNCIRRKENRAPIKHPFFHVAYEPLRQVSLAILRDEGASLYQQNQEAEGVIFDGASLWEEYLWTILRPHGFEHTENTKKKGAWKPLEGVSFYPDFFHRKTRTILDAKYKSDGNRQGDAQQVLGYMFQLNAVHGGLIKPDGIYEQPELIQRVDSNAEPTKWHDFALTPSRKATATEFCNEMRRKENDLIDLLRSQSIV